MYVVGGGAVHGEGQVHGHEVEDEEVALRPNKVPSAVQVCSVLPTDSIQLERSANLFRKIARENLVSFEKIIWSSIAIIRTTGHLKIPGRLRDLSKSTLT